ncbi:unnamed protein product [Onchocerca ochengi]|uniref:Retrotransposon protein n=1 Tax=Onchocerca ochengi TaxID=42157 RepID=A0A182EH35_ONCOC|nr:unnamed protein product [Onchocerca ochengi]
MILTRVILLLSSWTSESWKLQRVSYEELLKRMIAAKREARFVRMKCETKHDVLHTDGRTGASRTWMDVTQMARYGDEAGKRRNDRKWIVAEERGGDGDDHLTTIGGVEEGEQTGQDD